MTSKCGPDRFSPSAPKVDAISPPALLVSAFDALKIDWKKEQPTRTPFHKKGPLLQNDQWLGAQWGKFTQDLSKQIPQSNFTNSGATNFLYPKVDLPSKFLNLSKNNRITTNKRKVARKQIGDFLKEYYWPYFDVSAVNSFMPEILNQGRFRISADRFGTPQVIRRREEQRDTQLLNQLQKSVRPTIFKRFNAPLLEPNPPQDFALNPQESQTVFKKRLAAFSKAQKHFSKSKSRFDKARERLNREQLKARALIRDPKIQLNRSRRSKKRPPRISVLGLTLEGNQLPSNLFISQIAPYADSYLVIPQQLGELNEVQTIQPSLQSWFYFLVGMGLIPLWRHWQQHWGTAVVEDLLPLQIAALDSVKEFTNREFVNVLTPLNQKDFLFDDAASTKAYKQRRTEILLGVKAATLSFLDDAIDQRKKLLKFAAEDQGGGRIILQPPTFTSSKPWRFRMPDGQGSLVNHYVPEKIYYDRSLDKDARWLLRAAWPQVRSVTALCNQASVELRINAANNRWGGKHPPHSSHRQGTDMDWDMGMQGWVIPNLLQRRGDNAFGTLFRNVPVSETDTRPICLVGIDRLIGWIIIQANLIVGVRALLFGDEPLMNEAQSHLSSFFSINKPAHTLTDFEPNAHHNHVHADYLPHAVTGCKDPVVWSLTDVDNVVEDLHKLAKKRDQDKGFWRKLVGLNDIPNNENDFNQLNDHYKNFEQKERERHISAWKHWWRGQANNGIPLLPVWNPELTLDTRDSLVCGVGRMVDETGDEIGV